MKRPSPKHALAVLGTLAFATTPAFLMVGCDSNDGVVEEAGESVDDAFDNTGDAIDDAADEVEDAVDG
ncbi:MAG: hypothetical protein CMJ35_15920 [Phycisphaerae bacterium]|nr:hypothetical protein [Phycisphaerae bacterium]MBM93075.1 hypothetical protein [Phycisphaerae bacterium]|tara:strand:- start:314 stop:517 length:204 start_codon:yes stop_codon:yes gene_type:complete